jgi:hypothetical protein
MSSIIPIPTSRIVRLETRMNDAERRLLVNEAGIHANADNITINADGISLNATYLINRTTPNTLTDDFRLVTPDNYTLRFDNAPLEIRNSSGTELFTVNALGEAKAHALVSDTNVSVPNGTVTAHALASNTILQRPTGTVQGATVKAGTTDLKAAIDDLDADITGISRILEALPKVWVRSPKTFRSSQPK